MIDTRCWYCSRGGSAASHPLRIVNGVDIDDWNPATDEFLPAHYYPGSMEGKAECKRLLQEELGLQQRPDVPLIGWVLHAGEPWHPRRNTLA
eukprot:2006728-Pyramimonas_sp.AAC.1